MADAGGRMALSGNGQPEARFDPYVPEPGPQARSAFGPDDDYEPRTESLPEADVWDFDPDIKLPNEAYRGVRRAYATRPYRRVGLVVGLVVVVAVAVVIVMKLGADTTNRAAGGDSPAFVPSDLGAGPPTSPQLSATPETTTGAPVAASPAGIPAFTPLTFEAEAGPPTVKRRGAAVEPLS